MEFAIDLGARKRHTDERWPGITAVLRALPATVALFCRDQAKAFDGDGTLRLNDNRYYSWLFRFGVEALEGMRVEVEPGKAPPFLVAYQLMDSSYPIVSTYWFDRVHPAAVRAFGREVDAWNHLTDEFKKNSELQPGGDAASGEASGGTATPAAKPSDTATATTSPAASP